MRLLRQWAVITLLLMCARDPLAAQTAAENGSLLLNPLRAIPRSNLSGFRDKPLFLPGRAEVPLAPAAPPVFSAPIQSEAPPSPPPGLTLIGIVKSGDDAALVREKDSAVTKTLKTGDHIGTWLVTILSPRTLRLTDGGRIVDYQLFAHEAIGPKAQ